MDWVHHRGVTEQPTEHARPPLRRSSTDRVIAGVCGGLSRTLGVDPVVVRVLAALLVLAGGAGIAAYIIAWILIPDDSGKSAVELSGEGRSKFAQLALIFVLAVAALWIFDDLWPRQDRGFGVIAFVLLLVLAWQFLRKGPGDKASGDSASSAMLGEAKTPAVPSSVLGRVVWSLLAIIVGLIIALNLAGITDISTRLIGAVVLGFMGLALIFSAFVGRARSLIGFGIVIALLISPSYVQGTTGVGERTWRPTAVSEIPSAGYDLGVGSSELDLRQLAATLSPGQRISVKARIALGELTVLLPVTTRGVIDGRVDVGQISFNDEQLREGTNQTLRLTYGASDAQSFIDVDARVAVGQIKILTPSNASEVTP